mgnify:CR=1 FL=1
MGISTIITWYFWMTENGCGWEYRGSLHPKEAKAAEAFGFPEFIRRCDIEVDLSEEEQEPEENVWVLVPVCAKGRHRSVRGHKTVAAKWPL